MKYIKLKDLAISIQRGVQIKKSELEKLEIDIEKSNPDKRCFYFNIPMLRNGGIEMDYQSNVLERLPVKKSKYLLKNNDLILVRSSSSNFRTAIASDIKEQVLVTGNFYCITLDTDKVDPWYVQAFLSSEAGQKAILEVCHKSNIYYIKSENVGKIKIPLPPRNLQETIVELYLQGLERIKEFEGNIAVIRNNVTEIWNHYLTDNKEDLNEGRI